MATLSDIADAFNMPMSTAHIHLATLVESGYVIKEDCEYQCGLLCLRTGRELRDRMELFQAAKAEIDDLQENANVGTIENGYMVQLYKSEDIESIDDNAPLGDHLYLHSTATGKAMFAQFDDKSIDRIVECPELPKSTAATITTQDELESELTETRERGYAINSGEHFAGCSCRHGSIMLNSYGGGAISLSGPLSRRIENVLVPEFFDKRNIIELKLKQY